MGRVKLKIKRLENISSRQITYSKRRSGILKKARELSILCDIDIVLLMFSPNGRPTLFHGRSNIEEVILKFFQQTPQERAKRKLESLEGLRKTFKKLEHEVNIQDFLGSSSQMAEELSEQANFMRVQLMELQKRLSYWSNIDKIGNMEHLRQMEDLLRESINRISFHKENFGKCQLMPFDCTNQFQNGMPLSLTMNGIPEAQQLSWLPNNGNQHILMSHDPNFLHHGEMECSTDSSVPGYSGYFSTEKQTEMGNSTSVDNIGQDGGTHGELSSSACLSSHVGDQYSYPPYSSLDLPDDNKFKPVMELNVPGSSSVYQMNGNFELPGAMYDNVHHAWVPASGPCEIAMYQGNSYHQQSN